jgi:hypothetical protein
LNGYQRKKRRAFCDSPVGDIPKLIYPQIPSSSPSKPIQNLTISSHWIQLSVEVVIPVLLTPHHCHSCNTTEKSLTESLNKSLSFLSKKQMRSCHLLPLTPMTSYLTVKDHVFLMPLHDWQSLPALPF